MDISERSVLQLTNGWIGRCFDRGVDLMVYHYFISQEGRRIQEDCYMKTKSGMFLEAVLLLKIDMQSYGWR